LLAPSPHRREPLCAAKGCGGCAYLCTDAAHEKELKENSVRAERVTENDDFVKAVGSGIGNSENEPALYIAGRIFGEYGFWKSLDSGKSWAKINTHEQMFGPIVSMDGDFRKNGRVYIATGFRGGLYGEPVE